MHPFFSYSGISIFAITLCRSLCADERADQLYQDPCTPCKVVCCVEEKPSLLAVAVGVFNCGSVHRKQGLFQVEYKPNAEYIKMRPVVGAFGTTRGSFFFYGGFAFEIYLSKNLVLVPGFAPGIYIKGHGKDLGLPLEFRSSLELSYCLPNQGRIGAQVYHLSNASISKRNPGANSWAVFYAIPLR
jgi:hypothetical protein